MEPFYTFTFKQHFSWKTLVVFFIVLFFNIFFALLSTTHPQPWVVISVWVFFFGFSFIMLKGFRTKLTMLDNKLVYRQSFVTKELPYSPIRKIRKEHYSSASRKNFDTYFILYGDDDEPLMRIPIHLLGNLRNQVIFLSILTRKAPSLSLDDEYSRTLQAAEEGMYLINETEDNIYGIVIWIITGIALVSYLFPFLINFLFHLMSLMF